MKLWGRFVSILLCGLLLGVGLSAHAAVNAISGLVVDDLNKPIANTSVTLTRGGVQVATIKTNSVGFYSFNVDAGSYSIKFVPPTTANGKLNAYDILAPLSKPLNVQLTKPMPGRAFLTGNLTTAPPIALSSDTTIYFSNTYATQVDTGGNYRLMPTAGTNDYFKVKAAAAVGNFSFGLYAQERVAINQDTIANFVVPTAQQKVRVVTSAGLPVVGARVEAGQGAYGTDFAAMGSLDGLGSFKAGWKDIAISDSNGYVNLTTVKMNPNAYAGYLVTAPPTYKYLPQQFTKLTGAGDITLVMTNSSSILSGTVKDENGIGLAKVSIGFGETWTETNTYGAYSKPIIDGSQGNYSLTYRSGSATAGSVGQYVTLTPQIGASKLVATGGRSQDFTLRFDTVKVKVVDTLGNPVAKAHVQLSDISGYASVSRYTLISGQPSAVVSMSANAPTDLNGIAYIKTLHLDSATTGSVVVTPATGSALSWKSEKTEIGAGSAITVILARPTVTLSGKVSLSDGTPVAPYTVSFSDGRGGDQGSAKVDATTGTYSMQVPVGIKGAFYLSCPAAEMQIALSPFCMSFYGGSRTITANTVVDITIPTEKTRIHVTDPNGIGLSNVSLLIYHSVGMGTCTQATASIFADYPTVATAARSRVITDADGWAFATTLKLNAECEAWVELTPPATSRYQSRTVKMTVSNNADNLIVLTIPSPSISNGALTSNANGRVVTLIGDNFLGTTSVTWNGINISSFVVDSANQLRLLLPTLAASTGEAIVSNGGGIASFSLN